jgi:hypothetical protein
VRGTLRLLVVGFTILSLMVVAAVGVSASAGKSGASNAVRTSVVAMFSHTAHQGGCQNGDGEGGNTCRPSKKHHHHATGDHENDDHGCGSDGSGSD